MEENQVLNPFGYGFIQKVIDENRKPVEWYHEYLEIHPVVVENEFYILFSDGLLIKKGRSKFRSSQYLLGEKFKTFKKMYEKA